MAGAPTRSDPSNAVKRIFRAGLVILALAVALFVVFHTPVLAGLGNFLVKAGPPQKADVVLVLAGDNFGRRILAGAELVKQGWAPKAMISGPSGNYGYFDCDLAIPFAVKAGYPESYFIHLEHNGRSTEEEAYAAAAKLRTMGVKKVILVTSNYHTRRSGKIFHRVAPDIQFFVVAAPDEYFKPDTWWRDREARKIFLYEWMKTVAEW
jgi:uncharacterized SAM-binding protein YcdF (DUF218 family)